MNVSSFVGKPAKPAMLLNIPRLVTANDTVPTDPLDSAVGNRDIPINTTPGSEPPSGVRHAR
jgi:hypothetical protein